MSAIHGDCKAVAPEVSCLQPSPNSRWSSIRLRAKLAAMISVLEISDFRNHRSTRLEFQRFSVIAGPNGVGKSNALRALHRFSKFSQGNKIFSSEEVNFLIHGRWNDSRWVASMPDVHILQGGMVGADWLNLETESGPDVWSHMREIFSGWFLFEHPKWERMREILTPGEFWSSEGERWVIEKPQPEKKSA